MLGWVTRAMREHGGMCLIPIPRCFVKHSVFFRHFGCFQGTDKQVLNLQPGPCHQVLDSLWGCDKTEMQQRGWNGEGKGWRGTARQPQWTWVVLRPVCGLSRWHKFFTGFNQHFQSSRSQPATSQHSWLCWGLPAKPSHMASLDWDFLLDEQLILTPCRQHFLCSYCHNIPNPFFKKNHTKCTEVHIVTERNFWKLMDNS